MAANSLRNNLRLLWQVKNASDAEVGRTSGYVFLFFSGIIYLAIDIVLFIPALIRYNRYIAIGLIIHFILSGKVVGKSIGAAVENTKLFAKRSPKLYESLRDQDRKKFEEFLTESEDIVPQGHLGLWIIFIILTVSYFV